MSERTARGHARGTQFVDELLSVRERATSELGVQHRLAVECHLKRTLGTAALHSDGRSGGALDLGLQARGVRVVAPSRRAVTDGHCGRLVAHRGANKKEFGPEAFVCPTTAPPAGPARGHEALSTTDVTLHGALRHLLAACTCGTGGSSP